MSRSFVSGFFKINNPFFLINVIVHTWTAHRGRISRPYTRVTLRTPEISPEARGGISLYVVGSTSRARVVSWRIRNYSQVNVTFLLLSVFCVIFSTSLFLLKKKPKQRNGLSLLIEKNQCYKLYWKFPNIRNSNNIAYVATEAESKQHVRYFLLMFHIGIHESNMELLCKTFSINLKSIVFLRNIANLIWFGFFNYLTLNMHEYE